MKLCTAFLAPLVLAFVCDAIPANHFHTLQDTGNQTTGEQAGWISQALIDAPVAINRMIDRSEALVDFLNSNTKSLSSDKMVVSTLHTFQAIFGQVWWGNRASENEEGVNRVRQQINRAKKLAAALSSDAEPPIWEFYCDDKHLDDEDPFGEELLQYEYWDNRPAERGGQTVRYLGHLQGSCRDNELGLLAFLDRFEDADTETITFCPDALNKFTGESLNSVRAKSYGKGERNLDDIRKKVLGINLLHELSHSKLVLGMDGEGENDYYVDTPYSEGINGAAYGWECVTKINESEDSKAENNADSFAFYVTAMYVDKNDWSTGESAVL